MIYPSPGYILLEVIDAPHTSKLARENDEESNYGKVLDWGLPLVEEGAVLNVPAFTVGTNDEGQGGSNRKLKKGDILIFEERTARKMSDDYSPVKLVEIRFDNILALYEENK